MRGHAAVAAQALDDGALVAAVLDDYEAAPIAPRLRAALRLVEKLTSRPDEMTRSDIAAAVESGITHGEIEDLAHVVYLFSIYNRLAEALGWQPQSDAAVQQGARRLLTHGY
jgi:uncharacterized peroxidase-related enzyme